MSKNIVKTFAAVLQSCIYRGQNMGTFGLVERVGIAGETLQSDFDYFEL